jgi:hypothetical protein
LSSWEIFDEQLSLAQVSRRRFLATLGTGAAMTVSSSFVPAKAFAPLRPRHFVLREDRFGRVFPDLPPFFASVTDELKAATVEIGKPGGLLDAKDNLSAGPAELIVDPELSENNPNNPTHTSGTTFMGQFMDHDMTFDLSSRLGVPTEPGASANSRTPAFDLDSVYGAGPLVRMPCFRRRTWATWASDQVQGRERRLLRGCPARRECHSHHFGPTQR